MPVEGYLDDVVVDLSDVVQTVCDSAEQVHRDQKLAFYLTLQSVYVEAGPAELIRSFLADLVSWSAIPCPCCGGLAKNIGVHLWSLGALLPARYSLLVADDRHVCSGTEWTCSSPSGVSALSAAVAVAGGTLSRESSAKGLIWRAEFPRGDPS